MKHRPNFYLPVLIAAMLPMILPGQPVKTMNSSQIKQALGTFPVLGSVLFVAAHPDDENTRVIAYMANERKLRTAYLSVTRGDGGQNLIGTEQGDLLGIIRSQELLAARRIDGGEQFFTRAIDFGYSKSPEEALSFWGKEETLSDMVWVIRTFRPDVIITRFTPERGGHGHHRASAILAEEAFSAAADSSRFPEQLGKVKPWQAKRLLWNAWFWGVDMDTVDTAGYASADVGTYNPLLGNSYNELAALSRSMHKSQGFGSSGRRGSATEYFQLTAGEPIGNGDIMDGIDISWKRIPGGAEIAALSDAVSHAFDPLNPAASIPALLEINAKLAQLPAVPWVEKKRSELNKIILACSGVWVEAIADDHVATPGDELSIEAMVVNRSSADCKLIGIDYPFEDNDAILDQALSNNQAVEFKEKIRIPGTMSYTHPYWLAEASQPGRFTVNDQSLIGQPESSQLAPVIFRLKYGDTIIEAQTPLLYRWTDPVDGEKYRGLEILPAVSVKFDRDMFVFGDVKKKSVKLTVRSARDSASGMVNLAVPNGWFADKTSFAFDLNGKGSEQSFEFTITPPATPFARTLTAEVKMGSSAPAFQVSRIDYPHIPVQTLTTVTSTRLVRINMNIAGKKIGYIMGSGDDIPEALQQIGYEVSLLTDDDLDNLPLRPFDAIVTGIRAYNTRDRLRQANSRLLEYVKNGGTMVVQYNTAHALVTPELGPYPFKISRERVTQEDAPVSFVQIEQPLITGPNQILQLDFRSWVQERGLYFADEWDSRYQPVLSSHDPGEPARKGGLLYAKYGRGTFIYTGYSFFRQLPAGVPGAYRLFVNLLSAK